MSAEAIPAAERDLLAVVFSQGPEMGEFVLSHMNPDEMTHPAARELLTAVQEHRDRQWSVHEILESLHDPDLRRVLGELVFRRYEISKGWSAYGGAPREPDPWEIAERALQLIRQHQLDRELDEALELLRAAESRGESLEQLHLRIARLQQEKVELAHRRLREGSP